ncbi:ABC transporter permease protein [Oceanicola granulosus HTCC2516]|uniref:ABC transporter permease protein n=1 Tax=Oceanicola granulosus (strain ATCC BAA-861 / DSM 15982 / KCTC 12143 / HTCC2516) TaxID=314256 RepID=Q2CJ57_OCEGH|nr:ABC transporter permease [Oceanicola granulosus]EAR52743.1 ABC transporter permease protein [Oceanicola granulosus HTCC2516]
MRWLNASLLVGLVLTLAAISVALLSLVWLPYHPNIPNIPERMLPPGAPGHPLGTDTLGRDIVAQLMVGARTSMLVGAGGATISLTLGTLLGLWAAATGRMTDEAISRLADIMLSIPGMVTALVLAATLGSGMWTTILALSAFFTPSFIRVSRSAALAVLQEDFVTAARLYGRGRLFVLARHVLPNIAGVLIVQFTLYFAAGILTEAGLSYLGVGMSRPGISWGLMLNEAQNTVGVSSPLALWPGLAIVVVVLGLNLLGDGLRDVLDPKLARRAA